MGQEVNGTEPGPAWGKVFTNYFGSFEKSQKDISGSNVVWNYSLIEAEAVSTTRFMEYAAENMRIEFEGSNLVMEIPAGSGNYTYYTVTGSCLKYKGFESSDRDCSAICYYNDDWTVFSFPLKFDDEFRDSFMATSELALSNNVIRTVLKAEVRYHVDGSGTLITPFGKHENVLRIRQEISGSVSSADSGSVDPSSRDDYKTTKYIWLSATTGGLTELCSTFDFINFFFQEPVQVTSSVSDSAIGNLFYAGIYPNPANTRLNIKLAEEPTEDILILVYDAFGKMVKAVQANAGSQFRHTISFPIDELVAGVYQVCVYGSDRSCRLQFVKQ